MNDKPPRKPGLRDFLNDLRGADALFWIVAALVALIFLFRWLVSQP